MASWSLLALLGFIVFPGVIADVGAPGAEQMEDMLSKLGPLSKMMENILGDGQITPDKMQSFMSEMMGFVGTAEGQKMIGSLLPTILKEAGASLGGSGGLQSLLLNLMNLNTAMGGGTKNGKGGDPMAAVTDTMMKLMTQGGGKDGNSMLSQMSAALAMLRSQGMDVNKIFGQMTKQAVDMMKSGKLNGLQKEVMKAMKSVADDKVQSNKKLADAKRNLTSLLQNIASKYNWKKGYDKVAYALEAVLNKNPEKSALLVMHLEEVFDLLGDDDRFTVEKIHDADRSLTSLAEAIASKPSKVTQDVLIDLIHEHLVFDGDDDDDVPATEGEGAATTGSTSRPSSQKKDGQNLFGFDFSFLRTLMDAGLFGNLGESGIFEVWDQFKNNDLMTFLRYFSSLLGRNGYLEAKASIDYLVNVRPEFVQLSEKIYTTSNEDELARYFRTALEHVAEELNLIKDDDLRMFVSKIVVDRILPLHTQLKNPAVVMAAFQSYLPYLQSGVDSYVKQFFPTIEDRLAGFDVKVSIDDYTKSLIEFAVVVYQHYYINPSSPLKRLTPDEEVSYITKAFNTEITEPLVDTWLAYNDIQIKPDCIYNLLCKNTFKNKKTSSGKFGVRISASSYSSHLLGWMMASDEGLEGYRKVNRAIQDGLDGRDCQALYPVDCKNLVRRGSRYDEL